MQVDAHSFDCIATDSASPFTGPCLVQHDASKHQHSLVCLLKLKAAPACVVQAS